MAFPHFIEGGGGYVYLVRDAASGLHKLGRTTRLYDRLKAIATGTVGEAWLVGYIACNDHARLEGEWKRQWSAHWVVGEWFRLAAEQTREFRTIRSVCYRNAPEGAHVPVGDPLDFPVRGRKPKSVIRVGEPIPRRWAG